ncbi:MAG: 16S rRNA (guanine(966)-N(2))-methyltransferase RsmD [Gracilibacteraceae bacterium]|jgi:16S rRNA (guanine966-N2)-methyltransferase|nr:16S rRNA (guanine(966)-N(2))-methyltransferase RsmD [Gracilibacteraceae bacterium]
MTRLTGGTWKGRRLHTLPGLSTRPTAAKAREALFSVLGSRVDGASVLDLFAGSGALSWEALSRGAARARLVEKERAATQVLRANRDLLGATAAEIVPADVFTYLARAGAERFDLIFLDPPYRRGLAGQTLDLLKNISLLQYNGVVVAETEPEETLDSCLPLELCTVKRYGGVRLWFFQHRA